jgi:hypothetical protein
MYIVDELKYPALLGIEDNVTNSQGSISRWKFIALKVQYTTLDYS